VWCRSSHAAGSGAQVICGVNRHVATDGIQRYDHDLFDDAAAEGNPRRASGNHEAPTTMMLHAYLAADPKAKREQFAHQLATAVDLDDARPTCRPAAAIWMAGQVPSVEIAWVMAILTLTIFLFAFEVVGVDVAAVTVMVLLGLTTLFAPFMGWSRAGAGGSTCSTASRPTR
jgi:hypothetical protein